MSIDIKCGPVIDQSVCTEHADRVPDTMEKKLNYKSNTAGQDKKNTGTEAYVRPGFSVLQLHGVAQYFRCFQECDAQATLGGI
jgi:hypothetical protein